MTFYEAALRVLEGEGHPLHFSEITEKSISQNLLSHVGKTPEQTMLSRLAAMARRPRDRRVIVTAKDTFALTDWGLPEDAAALAEMGVPDENPDDALPPLRPVERHPESRNENVRSIGRGERRRRDEEDERGDRGERGERGERGDRGERAERGERKRLPPIAEVVYELLSEAGGTMQTVQLLERAQTQKLVSAQLPAEHLLTALLEDNQRRIDAGRRPQFRLLRESGEVTLERTGSPSEAPSLELQAAFAQALGIPLEGGRPVLPSRSSSGGAASSGDGAQDLALVTAAKTALKDARRGTARIVRRRLAELEAGTFEKAVVKLLHALGFRELKVAKRSKDGPLLTARRRDGSLELRYAVRGGAPLDRRTVQDLRRDLGHYAAQAGLLVSPQELRQEARSEATGSGAFVMAWCGDALGEKFLETRTGVRTQPVELFELDESFFDACRVDADEAQRRREERAADRERTGGSSRKPDDEAAEARSEGGGGSHAERNGVPSEGDASAERDEGEDGAEGADGEEGPEGEGNEPEAGAAAPSSGVGGGRRRRRRRRGRRGRGGRPDEGAPGPASGDAASTATAAPAEPTGSAPPPPTGGGEPAEG